MKIVICGASEIKEYSVLLEAIKAADFKDVTEVVSGHCKGVDMLGERWCKEQGLILTVMEADWKNLDAPGAVIKQNAYGKYNNRAGIDRNKKMVDYADAVLAVQTLGNSPGTQDTIKYAKSLGKPVYEYKGERTYEYTF